MKNLKKFVALLLAGVMAMVMLTACSGGGTDAEKKQENEILNELSKRTEAANLVKEGNGKLQNSDSKLYIETKDFLNARIEADTDALVIFALTVRLMDSTVRLVLILRRSI